VYSCPGLAFLCLPIDTAPTWHLLPLHVALPLWFRPLVALFGPGSAGWETVGRMGWFLCLPLLGATVRTRTRLIPLCLRFAWFTPSCGFWHFLPRFGSRNLCACFLPRSPGFAPGPRFPLAPSGHARDPESHASHSGLWAGFGVVCGGTVGLARSPVLRGAHAAIATVSSSCPIGFSFPGWVSYVVEGTRGGFWLR